MPSFFFSSELYFTKTCHGKEEGGNKHTWKAQYNGELYAAFGKDESLPKRNLLILSQDRRCDDLLHGRGLWFKSRMAQLRRGKE